MKNNSLKKILSGIMAFSLSLSLLPMNIQAAQSNEYIDPADYWIEANGRTNEFDINATTTYETFYCPVCDMQTTSLVYRVPEYTRSGESALTRNIRYSDGTFIDESGYGDINFGTPGINGYYMIKLIKYHISANYMSFYVECITLLRMRSKSFWRSKEIS